MIRQGGEAPHRPERIPVAIRIDLATVVALHLVRHVRDRVALPAPIVVGDLLVPSRERNGLEGDAAHLVAVREEEIEQRPDLGVVHAVDDGGDGRDVDARVVHHFDRLELDVEEVADVPMFVGVVRHAVELEIRHVESGLFRRVGELRLESEAQPVGRGLHGVVPDLLRVAARLEEVRRHGRFAARELHRHLPARLERDGRVEDLLDLVQRQLVHVPHLVRIHEARVAHHVAAVGEIDGEDRAAAVLDRRRSVPVDQLVTQRAEIAPGIARLDDAAEFGIDGKQILERAVVVTRLANDEASVLLGDSRLHFADVAVHQLGQVALAAED